MTRGLQPDPSIRRAGGSRTVMLIISSKFVQASLTYLALGLIICACQTKADCPTGNTPLRNPID